MKIVYLLLLLGCLTTAISANSAAEELRKELMKLQSFEANFVQQRFSNNRGLEDSTSGRFLLKRPKQFLWQTNTPFAQTIVSNGESLWTIDVDLEQVIISPIDDEVQNTPILLLASDQADLTELFVVEKQTAENEIYFILNPLDRSGNFEKIRIGFIDNRLTSLELFDSLGQMTRISMTNIRNNPIIDMSLFSPDIPEDYDVIDSRTDNSD